MSQSSDVMVVIEGQQVRTSGLAPTGHPEVRIQVAQPSLLPAGEGFLRYVLAYLRQQGAHLRPSQTMSYGYWLVKFQPAGDGALEAWEYGGAGDDFVPGVTRALIYWRDQQDMCARFDAPFTPPRLDQMAAVSAGVVKGAPVEGVRYPSPAHMSGWWLTTDRYDGNVKSLRVEHLYHVTAARPELARYLALPYGFRFALTDREYVWFDEGVADER